MSFLRDFLRRKGGSRKESRSEEIKVSGDHAADKILELHRDKSIQCLSLMDGSTLLAKVKPEITQDELDYVLMSTKFYLSNVNPIITILIERAGE